MQKNSTKHIMQAFIVSILSLCLVTSTIASATNAGQVGSWSTTAPIPTAKNYSGSAVHNGRVYIVGGWNGSTGTNTVDYGTINVNGGISSWTTSPNTLPQNVRVNSVTTHNGYLYSVGGLEDGFNRLDSVSYARINTDGTVGTWTTSGSTLPTTIQQSATFTYDGYIYVVGGFNSIAQSTIYYAPLNNDGSIGAWSTNSTSLPSEREGTQPVVHNGRVYIVGGRDTTTSATDSVYYASINPDHTIGSWTTSSNTVPTAITGASIIVNNGYLYALGGVASGPTYSTVYHTQIKSDGSIKPWTTSSSSLPAERNSGYGFAANGYVYLLGGRDSFNNPQSTSYYAPLTDETRTATVTNPITSKPIVVSTPAGTDLTCSSTTSETSLSAQDPSNDFPVGLVSFCYTTNAPSNQVTVTFVTNLNPTQVALRHFNSTTNTYNTVSGATFTATTYGGEPAIQATYTIEDNGLYDTDPSIGSVSDPVGLVPVAAAASAPNTGIEKESTLPIVLFLSSISLFLYAVMKRYAYSKQQ